MQVVKAVSLAKKERPDLLIEGPMQVLMSAARQLTRIQMFASCDLKQIMHPVNVNKPGVVY